MIARLDVAPRPLLETQTAYTLARLVMVATSSAVEEISDWQRQAGLSPRRPIHFRTLPGLGIQAAVKPR